jgi:hypothetical protein
MPDTAMPDTAPQPNSPATVDDLSQRETVLWHMRNYGEIDRNVADEDYGIKRLSARILELKKDGYPIETRKDEHGIAHHSLIDSPGENANSGGDATDVETAEDLWRALPEDSLVRDYVALLARCAKGDQTIGMLEDAVQPKGVSDWEAAACISRDVTVQAVTNTREKLCRASPLVQEHSHRKGKTTFCLHPDLN